MEQRHATLLRRLAQADRNWANAGNDPQTFQLLPGMCALTDINHPAWDRSWPGLTALDVDELEELGYVRVLERSGLKPVFALTVAGRAAGAQLEQGRNHADLAGRRARALAARTCCAGWSAKPTPTPRSS